MVVELLSHVLSGCPKLEPLTVVCRNLLKDYKYISTEHPIKVYNCKDAKYKIHMCVLSQMFCLSRSNLMFTNQLKIPKK